jgi:hypothetical protein
MNVSVGVVPQERQRQLLLYPPATRDYFPTRSKRIVRISTMKNYLFIEQRYHDDKIGEVVAKQTLGEILSFEK